MGYDVLDPIGWNIYQVGIDTCQNSACPSGASNGVPYYFYAYGHGQMGGVCGSAIPPLAIKAPLGNASNNTWWFEVTKSGTYYNAKIAGQLQYARQQTSIEACWNGVDAAQFLNELYNVNDLNPGSVSNKQFWSDASWFDTAGQHSINRPFGSSCDAGGFATQRCSVASNLHNGWYTWDSREP